MYPPQLKHPSLVIKGFILDIIKRREDNVKGDAPLQKNVHSGRLCGLH